MIASLISLNWLLNKIELEILIMELLSVSAYWICIPLIISCVIFIAGVQHSNGAAVSKKKKKKRVCHIVAKHEQVNLPALHKETCRGRTPQLQDTCCQHLH